MHGKLQWEWEPFKPTLESSSKSLPCLFSDTLNNDYSLKQLSSWWSSSVEAESSEDTSTFIGDVIFFSSFYTNVEALPVD